MKRQYYISNERKMKDYGIIYIYIYIIVIYIYTKREKERDRVMCVRSDGDEAKRNASGAHKLRTTYAQCSFTIQPLTC